MGEIVLAFITAAEPHRPVVIELCNVNQASATWLDWIGEVGSDKSGDDRSSCDDTSSSESADPEDTGSEYARIREIFGSWQTDVLIEWRTEWDSILS